MGNLLLFMAAAAAAALPTSAGGIRYSLLHRLPQHVVL